jgi:ubiquinone/menaquinone biosynthesis C-methylase UbiE
MDVKQAYDLWASQYDTNLNKTRDLEAMALRETLALTGFDTCLEIGCGTGKNTAWLITKATQVTAVDLSEQMLAKARAKITSAKVQFCQADITEDWKFASTLYDLVTFSLVLEHIEDLDAIFKKVSKVAKPNGYVYVGELHPFKQYTGTKARFETGDVQNIVTCYNHHVSDFTRAALNNGFEIAEIAEYFDDHDTTTIPRIFALLLRRKSLND